MKTKVNICHRMFGAKLEATEESLRKSTTD